MKQILHSVYMCNSQTNGSDHAHAKTEKSFVFVHAMHADTHHQTDALWLLVTYGATEENVRVDNLLQTDCVDAHQSAGSYYAL